MEVTKGKFEDVDIQDVVKKIHDADIKIIANYLFGLQGDTFESMQKTLDLSLELCTIAWNAYAVMALPGSKLYKEAIDKGLEIPEEYAGYAFLSYNTKPLPTEQLSPEEILHFRDAAFTKYHTHKPFLDKVQSKYGETAANNIKDMTRIKLKRKILGD